MRNFFPGILVIAFLATCFVQCDRHHSPTTGSDGDMPGAVFLANESELREGFLKVLADESDISMGGYILIVPVGIETDDERIDFLRSKLRFTLPNAVHVLDLAEGKEMLPSQRITVEGASLIFLVGNRLNKFLKMREAEQLIPAIRKAFDGGSVVAAINQATALAGDKRLIMVDGSQEGDDMEGPFRLLPGLGLVEGVIADCTYSEGLQSDTASLRTVFSKLGFDYIGIPGNGIVMVKNGIVSNLGKMPILLKLDDSPSEWITVKPGRKAELGQK
jgi:cyanophycinase-like exopeptidase